MDYCDVCISCLDSHSDGTHSLQRIYKGEMLVCIFVLSGHMMQFQVFPSLWRVTSCLCIDKIPEVAKTEVSKPKRYSL